MIAESFVSQVVATSATLNVLKSHIHGLDHWYRVWQNGQQLAQDTPGVDLEVVALFALFHDAMRENDDDDPKHGTRGWLLWKRLNVNPKHPLTPHQDWLLAVACEEHTRGYTHRDPTIGVCWDADRLDLSRVGVYPHPRFMSTKAGQRWAKVKGKTTS